MSTKSTLRAAAFPLLLLAGTAMPVAAPAVAVAQTTSVSPYKKFDGVFRSTSANNYWLDLDIASGQLIGTQWYRSDEGLRKTGMLVLDPSRSTPTKVVLRPSSNASGPLAELTLSPDGNGLLMSGSFYRRTDQVGSMTGVLNRDQVEARLRGRWKTPLGDLLIEGGPGANRQGPPMTGKLFRADGTTVRHLLSGPLYKGGDDSERTTWRWSTPTTTLSGRDLEIAISPDGTMLAASSFGEPQLGGMRSWMATKVGATAWPADAAPQPAPAPPPPEASLFDWRGIFLFSRSNDEPGDRAYVQFTEDYTRASPGTLWSLQSGNVTQRGTISIDQAESGPAAVVGYLKSGTADAGTRLVMMGSDAGQYAIVMVSGDGSIKRPMYMRRVTEIGSNPAVLTGPALLQSAVGKWDSPLGPLTISQSGGKTVGQIINPTTGQTLHSMVAASTRGEYITWNSTMTSEDQVQMVLSPDGREFQVFASSSRGAIGDVLNWSGKRMTPASQPAPSAPAPPQNPPPQAQPAPPPPPPPAPPPPVAQPSTPAPGTVQAGVFHQLERFDVRVDEVRAARDGKVHLFLTVANKSGQARSIGQGTFTAVMSDADGVGILSETAWRATGDEPRTFDLPPTVAAGGEFKVRFILQPSVVHGPLARIGLRESDKKVLYFDARAADSGSDASAPPAAGGGSFKSLSKLDVRIDRAGPARDGRFETFITFRNPTRSPVSVNAAAQRLSGTNSDGSAVTARYALYSVRGERGENDALPVPVYVDAGGEIRVRYVFDDAPTGGLTITDGSLTQTFTPGG